MPTKKSSKGAGGATKKISKGAGGATKKISKGAGGATKRRRLPSKIPGSVETDPLPMVRGEYYVGDLCYVLGTDAWKELCDLTYPKENKCGIDGQFTLGNGRTVVIFHLPNGDGVYRDEQGRTYSVDSGTLGITLTEGLETEYGDDDKKEDWESEMSRLGNIIDYKEDFSCMSITFDHPEVGPVSVLSFDDKVVINSADEMSGVGALLHGLNAVAENAANQQQTTAND
jgi:hypothetical protein